MESKVENKRTKKVVEEEINKVEKKPTSRGTKKSTAEVAKKTTKESTVEKGGSTAKKTASRGTKATGEKTTRTKSSASKIAVEEKESTAKKTTTRGKSSAVGTKKTVGAENTVKEATGSRRATNKTTEAEAENVAKKATRAKRTTNKITEAETEIAVKKATGSRRATNKTTEAEIAVKNATGAKRTTNKALEAEKTAKKTTGAKSTKNKTTEIGTREPAQKTSVTRSIANKIGGAEKESIAKKVSTQGVRATELRTTAKDIKISKKAELGGAKKSATTENKFDINDLNKKLKERKYISKKDRASIVKNSFYNLIYAGVFILFLVFCNYGFYNIEKSAMIKNMNLFSFLFLGVSIMLMETAYKEDKIRKCINGIETLLVGILTLVLPYVLQIYTERFIKTLWISGTSILVYYLIKSVFAMLINKRNFLIKRDNISKEKFDNEFEEEYDD